MPAPVLSQVWRDGRGRQVVLSRFLKLPEVLVVPHHAVLARAARVLLARSGTTDVVEAAVIALALRERATVVTSDVSGLRVLDDRVRLVAV